MGCRFCAYDRHLDRPRGQVSLGVAGRFLGLLGAWRAARPRPVLVSFLGGEPFLWPDLEVASQACAELGFERSLTTNGLALAHPSKRAWALSTLTELTVSLDGLAEHHDWARRQVGSHALVLGALRDLAQEKRQRGAGPLLRVNTVLMQESIEAFPALCDALADAGAEELTFNALGGDDRPEFFVKHRLLPAQLEAFAEALPALQARMRARGLTVQGAPPYLDRLRAAAAGRAVPVEDCGPGDTFWFLDAQGRLGPCPFTLDGYGVDIAQLRSPADLDALPGQWRAARAARKHPACLDCKSTQVFAKFAAAAR